MILPEAIPIIVLAAGSSSRMGQSKQLLRIENKPLLQLSVEAAIAAGTGHVVVVLGAETRQHLAIVENLEVDIAHNPDWKTGMGSSIKAGLRCVLSKNENATGVLIMVCDQPLVNSDHLKKLVERFDRTGKTVVSAYSDTHGVPVLFTKSEFEKLLALDNNQGAKKIIESAQFETIDFPGGAIDLDTLQDYYEFTGS